MAWTYRRRVLYYETDRMGVVHHSNYLRILEEARMNWMDNCAIRYSELEKQGIIIPVTDAAEQFVHFLRFDDPFSVTLRMIKYSSVKLGFSYEVHNEDTGTLCLSATSTHFFSKEERDADGARTYRPVSIRHEFPELDATFRALLAQDSAAI
ncbi:MAG: acyl-CoA thioesterase [Oscillospiraceae bacterium]|nr:acyl-CoA thioesterase [Oscillospiraceae bacterium]MCD8001308.1 acyl-CoA thioesterase [Oscillospiraceae bacterium]MCD8255660.1 acyl-CoA thioesterase [Oscillospiraceae bacterium]